LKKKGYSEEVIEEIIPIIADKPNNNSDTKDKSREYPNEEDSETRYTDSIEEVHYRVGKNISPEEYNLEDQEHKNHISPVEQRYHIKEIKGNNTQEISFNEILFMIIYGILMLFLVFWTSIKTEVSPAIIFLSFIPTFLTIAASYFFFQSEPRFKIIVWVVPLFLCAIFYGAVTSGFLESLQNIDVANVTVFNFLLSLVYILILDFFNHLDKAVITPVEKKIIKAEKKLMNSERKMKETLIREQAESPDIIYRKTTKRHGPEETDNSQEITVKGTAKELQGYVRSIEDTSKALNFVVGRVYSNKHGGSPALRDKIKIDSNWYNLIAEISREGVESRLPELRNVIYQIGARLNVLYLTETQIFGVQAVKRLNGLERNEDGSEKVIDVLIKNDKDPVALYYQSAVDYCNKAVMDIDMIMAQPKYHLSGDAHILK
jgi:hypothetical protein